METSDEITTLLPMVLLGLALLVIIILVLPQLKNFSNTPTEDYEDLPSGNSLNPLQEIFLEYRHSSVSDWINWITHQDLSKKNAAFEKLIAYLENEPEGIGSVITDVIKAVIAFNYSESFSSLQKLIENVRKRWGSYQTADQFYAQATMGLVELNKERSQSILINEFELIKSKRDPQRYMLSIIDALSKLPNDSKLNDFWLQVLTDLECELTVKERIVSLLPGKDVESRLSVIAPLLKFWNKSQMGKVPDSDAKVLENIFYTSQDLILNDNYELWDLILDACKHKITETLFVGLVVSLLESKKVEIRESLLLRLFEPGQAIRSEFLEVLAIKHSLNSEELTMIQEEYVLDAKDSEEIINITKFHAHKDVPESLEDTYQHLVRALSLNQESKNHNFPVLNLIPGSSSDDKRYLTECLTANHEYKLLNVNVNALLGSITELAKFKLLITQNKPCLIYFYGLHELVSRKFNDIEISNMEILSKLIKEFKVTTGVNFLLDVELSHEDLNNNDEFQECIEKVFHIKYGFVKDVNKPDLLNRQKILNDHIKKLSETRINSSAGLELIAKETEDYSLIEFLAYINSYLRFCLLVYGELKSPADLTMILEPAI